MNHETHLLGYYTGSCTTTSGSKSVVSKLELEITKLQGTVVTGRITTTGDINIDSKFSGTLESDVLTFATKTLNQKISIAWTARYGSRKILQGTFDLDDSGILARIFRYQHRSGTWVCERKCSTGYQNLKNAVKSFAQTTAWALFFLFIVGGAGYGCYYIYRYNPSLPVDVAVVPNPTMPHSFENTSSTPLQRTEIVAATPEFFPNYSTYPAYTTAAPTPTSKIGQFFSDPVVQQGITEAISAWANSGQGDVRSQPVHVRPYTKSDGTQVRQYNRALPNQGQEN